MLLLLKNSQIKIQATNTFLSNSVKGTIDVRYYQLKELNHYYHETIPDMGKEATKRYLLELYPDLIEVISVFYNKDKDKE